MLTLALIAAFVLANDSPNAAPERTNQYVEIQCNLFKDQVTPGDSTYLLISFKPKRGIYITSDPKMGVAFDTLKQFFSINGAVYDTIAKGYVDTRNPVRQFFTVGRLTPPGRYPIRGTLTYYYCSDEQGWCSRFRQPFALTLTVRK